ncbi:MAG TPA: hypothetical protein VLA13_10045, partial [Massilibacterium sp.]|nr:hypothetical protein [Massilibacterium sp.]
MNLLKLNIGDKVIKTEKTNGDGSWTGDKFVITEIGKKYATVKHIDEGYWKGKKHNMTGDWLDGWELIETKPNGKMKNQKTAYKFSSKHLGKAFMEELLEMGYEEHLNGLHRKLRKRDNSIIFDGETVYYEDVKTIRYNNCFQLESEYAEALAFAKEQIEPEFENGKWYIGHSDWGTPCLMKYNDRNDTYGFFDNEWSDNLEF